MKINQKTLFDHFTAIANNVKKKKGVDYSPVIRANCKKYAAEILKSFPEFRKEKKPQEEVRETKPKGGK